MQMGGPPSAQRLRDIQQLAAAAAAAACPAAAYASLHTMASAGFPADLAGAPGFLPLGGLSAGMTYSAAVNNFGGGARPGGEGGGNGVAAEFGRYASGGLVNGSGATPTYSSGGGSSGGGNMGTVAGYEGGAAVNGGVSGPGGDLFQPISSEGGQRRGSIDEAPPAGSHASDFNSNGMQVAFPGDADCNLRVVL